MRRGWGIGFAAVGLSVIRGGDGRSNLVLGTQLAPAEKKDLVAFLQAL
jgi:hypothetical protein